MPAAEDLPAKYQPSWYSSDPSTLQRLRFLPKNAGPGPWPTVVLIDAGQFKNLDLYGTTGLRQAMLDFQKAGYLVFSVNHRLAPPGLIKNQPEHDDAFPDNGRPPEQSNDIKQQIMAAKHDGPSNGVVFVVGGSSGATHSIWCALDSAPTVPGWGPLELPRAAVGLSGAYNLSLREADSQHILDIFIAVILNYTNTLDDVPGRAYQFTVSPEFLVNSSSVPPVWLFTTSGDPQPHQQSDHMEGVLQAHGVQNSREITIPASTLHAFQYWHTAESVGGPLVSADVIAFFNSNLP